jgi:hypothetical protein
MCERIPLPIERVKEYIVACHARAARVTELLEDEPRLLGASIDWGEGDWENGLEAAADRLSPDGCLVVGDLMSESAQGEAESIAYYRSIGDSDTAEDMEEEFFWYVDTAVDRLSSLGLAVETARFSRLSWGIKALKST